jgi:hypothetical protein
MDRTSPEARDAESQRHRERMRRSRSHLATSQFVVVVDPRTNQPAGIIENGQPCVLGFTNVTVAERFFPAEAGRPLVTSMRQMLMRLAPDQYLVLDPTEPDPIVVAPGVDRETLVRMSDPFPPLIDGLRAEFISEERAAVVHVAVTEHSQVEPWLTVMIDCDADDFAPLSDLVMMLCDKVDPGMWVNTAFGAGKALPRSARSWAKKHRPIVATRS